MAFNKLDDTNALLLYRVGPVPMCSPTLQVESVIVPPAISRASAVSDAEPGMFKSMYGMVRVVDLRVRFGVDVSQHKQPGQIIIVEVTGGHAGFWVDEIEDVIAFPQTGWSQIPAHVPGSVFSRALMQTDDIRLYAEFDRLDGFKASGYLREHIRRLQQAVPREEEPVSTTDSSRSPVKTPSVQSQSPLSHAAATTPVDAPAKTDAQSTNRSDEANTAIEASAGSPVNSAVKSPVKSNEESVATHNIGSQHAAANQAISAGQSGAHHRPVSDQGLTHTSAHQSTASAHAQAHHPPASKQVQFRHDRLAVSNSGSNSSKSSIANQAGRTGSDNLQTQVASTAAESAQASVGWIWWFVPFLLLFIVLFMFLQNGHLLQTLIARNESPVSQDRVDLQQDTVAFATEKTLDNNAVQSSTPTSAEADTEITPSVQIADDLSDVVYIEPDSGDLTITVNDYAEDDASENEPSVEVSAQIESDLKQGRLQKTPPQKSDAEKKQSLTENKTAGTESGKANIKQQADPTQNVKQKAEKMLSDKTEVADKTTVKMSRRLQHIVVKGDTLWSITERYINKPWRYPEVARLSNIDNPNLIYPGQRVIIVLNYKGRSE